MQSTYCAMSTKDVEDIYGFYAIGVSWYASNPNRVVWSIKPVNLINEFLILSINREITALSHLNDKSYIVHVPYPLFNPIKSIASDKDDFVKKDRFYQHEIYERLNGRSEPFRGMSLEERIPYIYHFRCADPKDPSYNSIVSVDYSIRKRLLDREQGFWPVFKTFEMASEYCIRMPEHYGWSNFITSPEMVHKTNETLNYIDLYIKLYTKFLGIERT